MLYVKVMVLRTGNFLFRTQPYERFRFNGQRHWTLTGAAARDWKNSLFDHAM